MELPSDRQQEESINLKKSIMKTNHKNKWGFLRETQAEADKVGLAANGLHRTGLDTYLKVIFPEISDKEWIHDEMIPGFGKRIRPDYRCEKLKLIIEFDGLPHYQQPATIKKDDDNQREYENKGYTVVRVPYFIQFTNEVVKTMFGRDVKEPLFDPTIPSFDGNGKQTPAACCPEGLFRMANEFRKYPGQYKVNLDALKQINDELMTGYSLLKQAYDTGRIEYKSMVEVY